MQEEDPAGLAAAGAGELGQPPDMLPAGTQEGKMWRCAASPSRALVSPAASVILGFFQQAGVLPLAERKMLRQEVLSQGPMLAVQAMLEAKDVGRLPYAASDGSAIPDAYKGSYGWVATAGNGTAAEAMGCKGCQELAGRELLLPSFPCHSFCIVAMP